MELEHGTKPESSSTSSASVYKGRKCGILAPGENESTPSRRVL